MSADAHPDCSSGDVVSSTHVEVNRVMGSLLLDDKNTKMLQDLLVKKSLWTDALGNPLPIDCTSTDADVEHAKVMISLMPSKWNGKCACITDVMIRHTNDSSTAAIAAAICKFVVDCPDFENDPYIGKAEDFVQRGSAHFLASGRNWLVAVAYCENLAQLSLAERYVISWCHKNRYPLKNPVGTGGEGMPKGDTSIGGGYPTHYVLYVAATLKWKPFVVDVGCMRPIAPENISWNGDQYSTACKRNMGCPTCAAHINEFRYQGQRQIKKCFNASDWARRSGFHTDDYIPLPHLVQHHNDEYDLGHKVPIPMPPDFLPSGRCVDADTHGVVPDLKSARYVKNEEGSKKKSTSHFYLTILPYYKRFIRL